ncbi:MAG TPA: response regulator [Chloroflexota bacterium]|nr:response regulator [Chloroflexota bacterium]
MGANHYVLIVEDDPAIRELLSSIVSIELGLLVRTAGSGPEALDVVAQSAEAPALAMLDMELPGLDGESLAGAIREATGSEVPVLLVSAWPEHTVSAAAARIGSASYVSKPFEIDEVSAAIHRSLKIEPHQTPP